MKAKILSSYITFLGNVVDIRRTLDISIKSLKSKELGAKK